MEERTYPNHWTIYIIVGVVVNTSAVLRIRFGQDVIRRSALRLVLKILEKCYSRYCVVRIKKVKVREKSYKIAIYNQHIEFNFDPLKGQHSTIMIHNIQ